MCDLKSCDQPDFDLSTPDVFFQVQLEIQHPYFDGAKISELVAEDGHVITESGTVEGQTNCIWIRLFTVRGEACILDELTDMLDWFEEDSEAFRLLTKDGMVRILFRFSGNFQMRSILPASLIQRIAISGIQLGVEIFPNWSKDFGEEE